MPNSRIPAAPFEGNIDYIVNVTHKFLSPVICWMVPVSWIIFVIVVGECKYLKIHTIIILGYINVDVQVLIVGVEVDVFGIDSVWLIVYLNLRRHLHIDVWK